MNVNVYYACAIYWKRANAETKAVELLFHIRTQINVKTGEIDGEYRKLSYTYDPMIPKLRAQARANNKRE